MLKEIINVFDLSREFENALLKRNHSQDSMYRYRKVLKEFQSFANSEFYSPEIGAKFLTQKLTEMGGFVNKGHHSKKQMYYIRTIRSLEDYFLFGTFYRNTSTKLAWPLQFAKPIDNYLEQLRIKKIADHFIKLIIFNFRCFILYLNKFDVNSFSDVTQQHVSGYIATLIGFAPKTIAEKIYILRGLFKYMYLNGFINIPLANGLPKVHNVARVTVPTVWSQDDIKKIKSAIDVGNPAGKRDYAIILLVARTGLRSGDVINLKLSDFNWNKNEIIVTQGKTKELLRLPLMEDVGWAIIDYLKNGRPITEYKNIFVSHLAPFKPIAGSSFFYRMITGYISKAGLPVEHKSRIGMHSLRHSLASELLQNNVEVNIIADILGHSNPETTRQYLSVNLKALRQCPLKVFGDDYE
jgi:integrase/recombinase XerD